MQKEYPLYACENAKNYGWSLSNDGLENFDRSRGCHQIIKLKTLSIIPAIYACMVASYMAAI